MLGRTNAYQIPQDGKKANGFFGVMSVSLIQHKKLFALAATILTLLVSGVMALAAQNKSADIHNQTASQDEQFPTAQSATPQIDNNQSNAAPAANTSETTTTTGVSTTTSASISNDTATTQVVVDGQNVTVPPNSSIHKTVISSDGNTKLDISVQNNTSGSTASAFVEPIDTFNYDPPVDFNMGDFE